MRLWKASALVAACTVLLACGGGGGGGAPKNPPSANGPVLYYKVGGTVVGLRGSGLILRMGTGETLEIESDGVFSFPTPLANLLGYEVGVISQPSQRSQICTASNATGLINGGDVTNIVISCATSSFPVRASIAGLEGSGLRLQLQVSDDPTSPPQNVELNEDGEVAFPTPLLDGTPIELSVAQQPMSPSQWCIVTNELPLQHVAGSSPISIACTSDTYQVGGTVFGLRGTGLVLTNNGTDNLQISANGEFAFAAPLFDHTSYEVKVSAQPTNMRQTCSVTNARGSVSGSDVTHVFINCNATQQLGSAGNDEAHATGLDAASNLYVAGRTNASLGEATNAGGWDGFVLKLAPDGDVQWWRQVGSSGDEAINSMAVTASGDLYIAGSTSGDLDGTNLGGADLFVAKYNTAGDRQWIRQIGTGAADVAHGVSIGPDGSVYVAGATEGELEAGTAAGASDLFIAKLDASGAWQWMRQLGSVQSDVAHALDVDAAGTLYIAGGTAGELDGQSNPSGGEIGFIVTYDSAGSKQSTRTLCPSDCLTRRSRLNSIALDGSGRAFFGGWTTTVGASNELGPKEALRGEFSGGAFSMLNWNGGSGERAINGIALDPIHGQLYSVDTVLYEFAYGSIGRVTRASLATFIENSIDIVGSPNTETELRAITSDGASNAYAVGFTRGSVDDHNNLGGTDMVIVRYNAAGEKL